MIYCIILLLFILFWVLGQSGYFLPRHDPNAITYSDPLPRRIVTPKCDCSVHNPPCAF